MAIDPADKSKIEPNRIEIQKFSDLSKETKGIDLGKYDLKKAGNQFYLEKTWGLKRILRWLNLMTDTPHYKALLELISQAGKDATKETGKVFDQLSIGRLKSRWSRDTQRRVDLFYQSIRILNESKNRDKLTPDELQTSRQGIDTLVRLRDSKEKITLQKLVETFEDACLEIAPSLRTEKDVRDLINTMRKELAAVCDKRATELISTYSKRWGAKKLSPEELKTSREGIVTLLRLKETKEKISMQMWLKACSEISPSLHAERAIRELVVAVRDKLAIQLDSILSKKGLSSEESRQSKEGINSLLKFWTEERKETLQETVVTYEYVCSQISPSLRVEGDIYQLIEAVRDKPARELISLVSQKKQVDQLPDTWEKGQEGINDLLILRDSKATQPFLKLLDRYQKAYNKLEEARLNSCDSVRKLLASVLEKINSKFVESKSSEYGAIAYKLTFDWDAAYTKTDALEGIKKDASTWDKCLPGEVTRQYLRENLTRTTVNNKRVTGDRQINTSQDKVDAIADTLQATIKNADRTLSSEKAREEVMRLMILSEGSRNPVENIARAYNTLGFDFPFKMMPLHPELLPEVTHRFVITPKTANNPATAQIITHWAFRQVHESELGLKESEKTGKVFVVISTLTHAIGNDKFNAEVEMMDKSKYNEKSEPPEAL